MPLRRPRALVGSRGPRGCLASPRDAAGTRRRRWATGGRPRGRPRAPALLPGGVPHRLGRLPARWRLGADLPASFGSFGRLRIWPDSAMCVSRPGGCVSSIQGLWHTPLEPTLVLLCRPQRWRPVTSARGGVLRHAGCPQLTPVAGNRDSNPVPTLATSVTGPAVAGLIGTDTWGKTLFSCVPTHPLRVPG